MNGQIVDEISHPPRWESLLKRETMFSPRVEEIKSTVVARFFPSTTHNDSRIRIHDFHGEP